MADGEKRDKAEGGAPLFLGAEGLDWSVRLQAVQRIEADPADDDPLEDLFAVTFAVDGPNAEAEIEVMVPGATDRGVVSVALDTLHAPLHAWADVIERQREAARTEMPQV